MCGGEVAGGRRRGRPPDGARCSRRAGLHQCKSFVEPRSTAPAVAGCRLVGCSVVSGRTLHSRAVAGVSQRVRVGLGPVLV